MRQTKPPTHDNHRIGIYDLNKVNYITFP